MKICMLRYQDGNGQTVFYPEFVTAIDAVGLAARRDEPCIIVFEVEPNDLLKAAGQVRITKL